MMNMQAFSQFRFRLTATLATIAITLSGAVCFGIPVGSVVRIEASSPSRVLVARHPLFMADVETRHRAKAPTAARNDVLLLAELLPASGALAEHLSINLANQPVRPLPSAAAFTVAEIVWFYGARRNPLGRSAPFASNECLRETASLTAIGLVSIAVAPRRATKHFLAGGTDCESGGISELIQAQVCAEIPMFTRFKRTLELLVQSSKFSGSGSEMIGAKRAGWDEVVGIERESAYVKIAKARLKAA